MIGVGVIGCGHWGPNHIRNFSLVPGVRVVAAADRDPERRGAIERLHSGLHARAEAAEVFGDSGVHAVVIATPTATHHALVRAALEAGKHVLCEKPLASTLAECRDLEALATSRERLLMVGHTFLYNAGILKLKELIDRGSPGRVYCMHAERTNLGPIRSDVNVFHDLASHDVSILNFLNGSAPESVSAQGGIFLQSAIEDVGFVTLRYPENVMASILVSWIHPRKTRRVTVVGDERMIMWDDLSPLGPLMVLDKTVEREPYYSDFGEFNLLTREGDINIPHVKLAEPLRLEAEHFIDCVRHGSACRSPASQGVAVAWVLEAVQRSIARGGAACRLDEA